MYCLKCGRETGSNQIFCDSCLNLMKRYPVKPDATVYLPQRSESSFGYRVNPRKRVPSVEERLAKVKKRNRWLIGAVIVLSLALSLVSVRLVQKAQQEQFSHLVGRNYTYDSTAD